MYFHLVLLAQWAHVRSSAVFVETSRCFVLAWFDCSVNFLAELIGEASLLLPGFMERTDDVRLR